MSNYARGAVRERRAMVILKDKMNCSYVARVAGSHSEFDIIGIGPEFTHLVQVKSTKTLPVRLISKLKKYKADLDAIDRLNLNGLKELWIFPPRKDCIKINVFPVEKYKRVP